MSEAVYSVPSAGNVEYHVQSALPATEATEGIHLFSCSLLCFEHEMII